MSADHVLRSSVVESRLTLGATPFNHLLGAWTLHQASLSPTTPLVHVTDTSEWSWRLIGNQMSIWNPAPKIAHEAITSFLDLWVEQATTTSAHSSSSLEFSNEIGVFSPNTSLHSESLTLATYHGAVVSHH
jgi:hypothetical protein